MGVAGCFVRELVTASKIDVLPSALKFDSHDDPCRDDVAYEPIAGLGMTTRENGEVLVRIPDAKETSVAHKDEGFAALRRTPL